MSALQGNPDAVLDLSGHLTPANYLNFTASAVSANTVDRFHNVGVTVWLFGATTVIMLAFLYHANKTREFIRRRDNAHVPFNQPIMIINLFLCLVGGSFGTALLWNNNWILGDIVRISATITLLAVIMRHSTLFTFAGIANMVAFYQLQGNLFIISGLLPGASSAGNAPLADRIDPLSCVNYYAATLEGDALEQRCGDLHYLSALRIFSLILTLATFGMGVLGFVAANTIEEAKASASEDTKED